MSRTAKRQAVAACVVTCSKACLQPVAQSHQFIDIGNDTMLFSEGREGKWQHGEVGVVDGRVSLSSHVFFYTRNHEGAAKNNPNIPGQHQSMPVQNGEGRAGDRFRVEIILNDRYVQEIGPDTGVNNIAFLYDLSCPTWDFVCLKHFWFSDFPVLLVYGGYVYVGKPSFGNALSPIARYFPDVGPAPGTGEQIGCFVH